MKKKRKKRRRIRPFTKLLLFIFILWLIFWWKVPSRGNKSIESFISEINRMLEKNAGYPLYKVAQDFISTYPDSENIYIAYFALGVYYSNLQKHIEAISNLSRALDFKKIKVWIRFQIYALRAIEYIKLAKYKEALEDVEIAISLTKNIDELAFLYYQKGFLENRLKQYDKAIVTLNRAKFYNPAKFLLVSILLEEAYAQRNLKKIRIARLIYDEIIHKYKDFKDAVKIAREALDMLTNIELLSKKNSKEREKLEKELKKALDFYPF